MPTSMRKAEAFIEAGGSTPTEKAQSKPEKRNTLTAFTLRLYRSKLDKLSTLKDTRKAERLAQDDPDREPISVNSLIIEAIDLLLKQEAKRATKKHQK
jgi:hypothetical protein